MLENWRVHGVLWAHEHQRIDVELERSSERFIATTSDSGEAPGKVTFGHTNKGTTRAAIGEGPIQLCRGLFAPRVRELSGEVVASRNDVLKGKLLSEFLVMPRLQVVPRRLFESFGGRYKERRKDYCGNGFIV